MQRTFCLKMCSDLKNNSLPPNRRKWKILLRSAAVFFALFTAAEIVIGIILQIYCFIPLDLLNIFGSVMLWRSGSTAWRIYFVIVTALSVMLEIFTLDLLAIVPEEAGLLPIVIPAVIALQTAAGAVLVIAPDSRFADKG